MSYSNTSTLEVAGEWKLFYSDTSDTAYHLMPGVLTYTPDSGIRLVGQLSLEDARDLHEMIFIASSEMNIIDGCSLFEASVCEWRGRANGLCQIVISAGYLITGYTFCPEQAQYFTGAELNFRWLPYRIPRSPIDVCDIRHVPETRIYSEFDDGPFRVSFQIRDQVALFGYLDDSFESRVVFPVQITSKVPQDFSSLIHFCSKVLRVMQFARGCPPSLLQLNLFSLAQSPDYGGAKACSVIAEAFTPQGDKRAWHLQFKDSEADKKLLQGLFRLDDKYKAQIIFANSCRDGNRYTVESTFFDMCRIVESSYGIGEEEYDLSCEEYKDMRSIIKKSLKNTFYYEKVCGKLLALKRKTFKEKFTHLDNIIYTYTGESKGLCSAVEEIAKIRNAEAHLNTNITNIEKDKYFIYTRLLITYFYAYMLYKAGAESDYIKRQVMDEHPIL